MVSAKDEMLMKCMKVWMTRFNTEDLKFLEDTFWMVSFNFSVDTISSTEVTTVNGETTDSLMEYFKIGKLSSGKTESTINQYIRVVHQLCDFCHKEINMITTDDVLSFMVKYKLYILSISDVDKTDDIAAIKYGDKLTGEYLDKYNEIMNQSKKIVEKVVTINA